MSDAIGSAVLDLKMLRPYLQKVPLLLAVGIVMDISMKTSSFVILYAAVLVITLSAYPFGSEEKSRLYLLQLSLPISRRAIVAGRYLQAAAIALAFALIAFPLSFVSALLAGSSFQAVETMLIALGGGLFSLIIVSLQFPFYYRMGFMKARYIVNLPLFLIFLLVPQIKAVQSSLQSGTLGQMLLTLSQRPALALCALMLLVIALGFFSFLLSYRFFKNKDL